MKRSEFLEKFNGSKYLQFISECRGREESGSVEIHHIYLKSFEDGRIDDEDNLIQLSIEDHIRAHVYLLQSFEDLHLENTISYQKAVHAVNLIFHIQWRQLSQEAKLRVLERIPEVAKIKKEASALSRKFIREAAEIKWNGDCMGMCHTEEAIQKSLASRTEKFGNPAGATHSLEVVQKRLASSKATHKARYGSNTHFLNTPEARIKAKKTMLEKYGSTTAQLHTSEARNKAKQSLVEKQGNCTKHMNTEEVRQKAKETRKQKFGKDGGQFQTEQARAARREACQKSLQRRQDIMQTREYQEWFLSSGHKNRLKAVGYYLKEKNLQK